MKIKCPCCLNDLEIHEDAIGTKTHCHHCGERFYVDARVVPSEYRIAALRARAQEGDKWSQCELGSCYANGDGVESDDEKAVNWYRKAAEQGYGLAQYKLAECYAYGRGLVRDKRDALKYYRMAAEKGVVEAQIQLGNCYDDNPDGEDDYVEAAKWYRKAAAQGNAQAQFEIGRYCEAGLGNVKGDPIEWYEKSAKQGNTDAQCRLANCYADGLGVEKDLIKALWWLTLAHFAMDMYPSGIACYQGEAMFDKILEWVGNVVDSNDAESMYNIGRCYATGNLVSRNEEEALKWYLKASEGGCVVAQREYGECLLFGRGVEKDGAKAYTWLQKAADAGDHRAQIDMSFLCLHGIGCDVDAMAADEWLARAMTSISKNFDGISEGDESEEDDDSDDAEHEVAEEVIAESTAEASSDVELVEKAKKAFGDNRWEEAIELARRTGPKDADLQSWMGNSYEFGNGVEKNLYEAFRWHKAAAENGDGWSQYKLGDFFEDGKGTEKNLPEAFRWYKAAAEKGSASAQNRLGLCYEYGTGTEIDLAEAFRWYKSAAENDSARGQCNLGDMYEFGKGTEKNLTDAFQWYKAAAENGDARGQYRLGLCYEFGHGVEKDMSEALKWYTKAAEQGDEDAKKKLAEIDEQKVEEPSSGDAVIDVLRDVLNTLMDRERQVVDFRFGISDGYCRTLDEVARLFNLPSREVRMIETKALRKLKRELENGDARVQFYLGTMYEKRHESGEDRIEAVKWYRMAAEQGHDGAKKKLADLEKMNDEGNVEQTETPVIQRRQKGKKIKKPSKKKAYNEMNAAASDVFVIERGIDVVEMNGLDDYLYYMEVPKGVDEESLMEASNELFHRVGVLPKSRNLVLEEETEYCTVHRNEYSGKYFVLFNHPIVMGCGDCGYTVKIFGATQRKGNEEDADEEEGPGENAVISAQIMKYIADGIKSGAIKSKSGEGYFVLKGEYYDAIEAGRKTTEYRDLTPHNLSLSIGIKTVKFQRGYGHPGKPPKQMRYEVSSVRLMDASDRECDPYAIPPGFLATTIAIHLGRRIG